MTQTIAPQDRIWLALARPARVETRVRGSRFLADVAPVDSAAGAAGHRQALRDEFPRATHDCWGVRVREGEHLTEQGSDAGEPSGTAGRPILGALEASGVEGASLVVVRWFGGTKLGTGPLARAYGDAAGKALAAAGTTRRRWLALYTLSFPHHCSGEVRRVLARLEALVRGETHGADAEIQVGVRVDRARALEEALAGATRGQGTASAAGRATAAVAP